MYTLSCDYIDWGSYFKVGWSSTIWTGHSRNWSGSSSITPIEDHITKQGRGVCNMNQTWSISTMYILNRDYIDLGSYYKAGYGGVQYELVMVNIDYVHPDSWLHWLRIIFRSKVEGCAMWTGHVWYWLCTSLIAITPIDDHYSDYNFIFSTWHSWSKYVILSTQYIVYWKLFMPVSHYMYILAFCIIIHMGYSVLNKTCSRWLPSKNYFLRALISRAILI